MAPAQPIWVRFEAFVESAFGAHAEQYSTDRISRGDDPSAIWCTELGNTLVNGLKHRTIENSA